MDAVTSAPSSLPTDVWRTLADQLPQLAWIADGSGKVLWVNRRWSEFTGLAAHELTERGWRPLLHPDASEQVERGFEAALAGSCQWQDEFPLRGKDGTYRQFLGRAEPVRGTDGEVAYWFGTATDISERFAAEEEARTAAQRLRRAVTIANLFVWETDWVTRKISWGENAAEILGLRPEDLPTGPDDGTFFVADEDAERLRGEFADALSRGDEAVTVEFRGRDGRFWRAECQIDRDADGKVLRVHGATRETTREVAERRRNAYLLQLDDALRMSSEASVAKSVAARLLGEELNASRVLYAEVSSDGRELLIEDEYLAPGVPSIAGVHRAPEAILSRHREGRPIVTADFRKDDHLAAVRDNPAVLDMPLCAILDAPLLRDGKLVGVLAVHDLQPRDWTEAEIDLAVATAERTWESVERSRTEEQLRFSEARFRSTAEALPGMLFLTDAVGNNLYVNPYYRDYAGVSDQDVAGDGWIAVVHPDDLSRVREASAEAIARGTIFGLDYRLRRKDGEWRWHSSRATPLRSNGDVVGWVGISLDVHDRRMAEEQARLAADEIAATYATAPIGLAVFDTDLRYIRVNQRLAEMNGTPMDEHIGKTLQEIVPGISGELGGAIRRALDGEEVWCYEVSGETKSAPGVLRTWRENWLPIRDGAGTITGAAGSIEEITREKEAEERYRAIFNSAAVGIGRVAPDGPFLEVNDRFCEILGRSREEILGGGWQELTHPDDLEGDMLLVERALAGEIDSYCYEKRYVGKTGGEIWVNLTVSTERDLTGAVKFFISVVEDIGERKKAEVALRSSEERIRIATDHAEVGFWDVDEVNGVLTWPPRVKALFGISPDVPVSMDDFYSGLHPDDRDRTAEAYAAAADPVRRALYDVEYRTIGKEDGKIRWVAAKGRGLFDKAGRCLRVVGTAIDITPRKLAEEALRRSEERYRALFESMDQGFCIIQVTLDEAGQAVDHRFAEINPAFSRQSGLPESVVGHSISDVLPDLDQSWGERYGRIAQTGEHARFIDYAAPLARWFEVYAFPIGQREECNVAVLFNDVTDRIRHEEELKRSEQELRLRLNAIPQMVWSTLPDGFHDFYNDRWYEFTGTPLGSTDGEGWNGMFHPDDQPRAWERWEQSLRTGEPYEIEYRLRHHSGAYRWVLGRALPIRNEAGEIVRWMGTCTDIDDRIAASRALQESEARLRAVIEAMPVGLIFADASGALTGSNEVIVDYLGHDMVESRSTQDYGRDYVAYHGDGRRVESDEYPLARALGGEPRPELECMVERPDGSRRWLRYVASPIRGPDGAIDGGVVASIDIDREKRLTESLEREVERVVAEREAAQEALRQSQKLEAMGQLTGGVAHDFNNLLTPIIGSLDLLQRKQVLDERTGRLVDGALASAEKARVLVQRLLAFARRQPLQPQAIDIGRIVGEMSELIDSTSGPRVRVQTEVPATLPPALGDGNQIEMALLNLSVNARDAMPDGGTLTIALRSEQPGAGAKLGLPRSEHVVLSVSDTGTGMTEETRRRAIEPFFSTKGIGKGTGLGLSMVHGLAAQLGGALDIRSAPGMGTSIELWLPVADGKVASGSPDAVEPERHGAGTALLVDDEELVRAATAGMLSDLGYRVIEAPSGEEAMALVADGLRPDLLVTDQLMPGLSGTDLAVQLRERMPKLPVLIVSGYADLDSLSPAFPHLSKPFRQAELVAALEKVTVD